MDLLDRFDMVDRVAVVDIEDRVNRAAMEMMMIVLLYNNVENTR